MDSKGKSPFLISTITGKKLPFDHIPELTGDDEFLEVFIPDIQDAKIKEGEHFWQRFSDFLPFPKMDENLHLGEGNTVLIQADQRLQEFTGISNLFLKKKPRIQPGVLKIEVP